VVLVTRSNRNCGQRRQIDNSPSPGALTRAMVDREIVILLTSAYTAPQSKVELNDIVIVRPEKKLCFNETRL
jgi:hypothetical protein